MPEQSGDSFDFCVLFRVYFTGKGASSFIQYYKKNSALAAAGQSCLFLVRIREHR